MEFFERKGMEREEIMGQRQRQRDTERVRETESCLLKGNGRKEVRRKWAELAF